MLRICRLVHSGTATLIIALLIALPVSAPAADIGAVGNGVWSSAATWTNGIPGPNDNAYIGSTYPTGAAANATVTLSQNTTVGNAYLGYGSGSAGTLDLGGSTLTATNLYIGDNGGAGSILRTGGGALAIGSGNRHGISLIGGNFSFAPGDVAASLSMSNNSTATTAASGNVANYCDVGPGCTLTLATDLTVNTTYASLPIAPLVEIDGSLNANGRAITTSFLNLGLNGGPFVLNNRGPLNVGELVISSQYSPSQTTFPLTNADSVQQLELTGVSTSLPPAISLMFLGVSGSGATCATANVGSVTTEASVGAGSTLNLGADLILSTNGSLGLLSVSGTLNANGHAISAPEIQLGSSGVPFTLTGRGPITTGSLTIGPVAGQSQPTFNLASVDTVTTSLTLYGTSTVLPQQIGLQSLNLYPGGTSPQTYPTATTSANGNVTGSVLVNPGCTLTLGADMTLSGTFSLSGSLNFNGYSVTAASVELGTNNYNGGVFSFANRGPIITSNLTVYPANSPNQNALNVTAADQIGTIVVNGSTITFDSGASVRGFTLYTASPTLPSTGTISATRNVTGSVTVEPGSTLNLGADLNLTGSLAMSGTLNANGHAISAAGGISLGAFGGPFLLTNRGPITTSGLVVSSQSSPAQTTFNLTTADSVTGYFDLLGVGTVLPIGVSVPLLELSSSNGSSPMYATATTSAVGNVTGHTLIQPGCTLTMGADLVLSGSVDLSGTLNANGHTVSVPTVYIGPNGGPVAFQNDGLVTVGAWDQSGGSQVTLHQAGDTLGSILLSASSALTIADAAGQTSGLTVTGSSASSLSIDSTSDLVLDINGLASGWVFRWADPNTADLQALINAGEVTFSYSNGG